MRDFLISLKEFAGDNTDLFQVEKEQQERDAKAADMERRQKVGGLLKPSELEEEELWLNEELRNEFAPATGRKTSTVMRRKAEPLADMGDGWEFYDL